MRVRHVVFVNDFCHVLGGADQVAIMEASALARDGIRVTFVAAGGSYVDARLIETGVSVEFVSTARKVVSGPGVFYGLWNPFIYHRISKVLRGFDPRTTVVHVHGWTKRISISGLSAVARSGLRWTMTAHDYVSICPNGALYDFPKHKICLRRPGGFACMLCNCDRRNGADKAWRVLRHLISRAGAFGTSRYPHVIAVSASSGRILRRSLPAGTQVDVVLNPIEIKKGTPVPVGRNKVLVFVGRLVEEKGAIILAKAATRLRLPTVFVGDGPMRDAISAFGPEARITGWLDKKGVEDELSSARALVFSSLWQETFGLVCLEALGRGIPVVSAAGVGAAEMILDGVNGWLMNPVIEESIDRALLETTDNVKIEACGRHAFEMFWAAPLSLDIHRDKILRIYNNLL